MKSQIAEALPDSGEIDVRSEQGKIVLSGSASQEAAEKIKQIAGKIPGIDLDNRVVVDQ